MQHEAPLQLKSDAPSMISRLLSRFVVWLMRKDLRRLADNYPQTVSQLVDYHDRMSILAINVESQGQHRILGVSTRTAFLLEALEKKHVDNKALIHKLHNAVNNCRKQRNEAKLQLQRIQNQFKQN